MNNSGNNGHVDALAEPNSIPSASTSVLEKTTESIPAREELKEQIAESFEDYYQTEEFSPEFNEMDQSPESMESAAAIPVRPVPVYPYPQFLKNKVYGSYQGQLGNFVLELRVDIDGNKALQKVSGDYYIISGRTKSYFGSFIVDRVSTRISNGYVIIQGTANTTWNTSYKKLRIVIKQTLIFQSLAPASMRWYHQTTNSPGALYMCNNTGRAFRRVYLEQDRTLGVVPFNNYATGSLPSGGPSRTLDINSAYAEAGVEMLNAGIKNVVPMSLAGPDAKWTNAELHNAMVNHFSIYTNAPAWRVWLLHAYQHINGPGLYGIMFDQAGKHRQGCAVFYRSIQGVSAERKRLQLYTCVHELGHCFNLLHSWQKSYATPPKSNIPNSLSWMNYPWGFPGGATSFWNSFPFQFDPVELAHIRHGFRNNVIMGGNPFTVGSSLHEVGGLFEDNVENHANLDLELEAKSTYLLGEPVVLETKLKTTSTKDNRVINCLHANFGFVNIGIKKPNGEIVVYEPLAEMCIEPKYTVLNRDNPGVYESSYIGYGKQGFIFDQVGNYQIRAVFHHEDGSRIVSDTLDLRVKFPTGKHDDEVAELFMQEDVGYLLAFMGSDGAYLKKGNDALDLVLDKYKDHPLAVYAQFIKGVNEQRTFKTITAEKEMEVRSPNFAEGEALLNEVIDKSKAGKGLDNISLNQSMQILAKAYQREGNKKAAQSTVKSLVTHFTKKPFRQEVKDMIARNAELILAPDKDDGPHEEEEEEMQ